VNLPASDLKDLPHLHIRSSAIHVQHIHTGHTLDLDVMNRASMLEHRKRINQPLLFVHQTQATRP
jgi:hypothetical protein